MGKAYQVRNNTKNYSHVSTMSSPNRSPFKSIRQSFVNLPIIQEECSSGYRKAKVPDSKPPRGRFYASRKKRLDTTTSSSASIALSRSSINDGFKSQSVLNLSSKDSNLVQEQELERENKALKDRCLIYEAIIGTLQSEAVSYSFKSADALENLQATIVEMTKTNKALMEECWRLEERLVSLRAE